MHSQSILDLHDSSFPPAATTLQKLLSCYFIIELIGYSTIILSSSMNFVTVMSRLGYTDITMTMVTFAVHGQMTPCY